MRRKRQTAVESVENEPKLVLSVNYGDVTANVHATDNDFVAQITGKMPTVNRWQFNAFIINFVNSIKNAAGYE